MIEQEDGTYKESNNTKWPINMKYNSKLSNCIDINGNVINNAIMYDNSTGLVQINTKGTTYCYLYFDKDSSVFGKVVNDYLNNRGVEKLSDSEKGNIDYDTYYYKGNITNNNVLYGGFCWKMVITTENNGVKMIYNGEPQTLEDGSISCNNTKDNAQIGTSAFDTNYNSLAYVGYMYNEAYSRYSKTMSGVTDEYVYGNSFTYSNGTYTLSNTKSFSDWNENYNTLSNNHYTCFNTSGICTSLYYIYSTSNTTAYYITLTNGKSIEDAINEMLYADDVNTIDSTIKAYIDSWYEDNLKDKLDSDGNLYSNYLQNTIFCANRDIYILGLFNPNGGSTNISTTYLRFDYNSLDCTNKTDQFTLKVDAGGAEDYGNNALKYPIGLLNYKEVNLASSSGYLYSGNTYWLISPYNFYYTGIVSVGQLFDGYLNGGTVSFSYGVRPVVSLSDNVEIANGNGAYNSPYQIGLKPS